jgi:polyisoprenoid-binding protein YceI
MIRKFLTLVTLAALSALPAFAGNWDFDAAHSSVGFTATHLVIAKTNGTFGSVTADVNYDEKNPSSLTFSATIDVNSINTNNEKRDGHLKSEDFFDAANHPNITFKSTKTEVVSPGKFKVTGDLTIRGTTKPVVLDVEGFDKSVLDPWGNTKTVATAKGKINRFDYGLKWDTKIAAGDFVVGNEILINIEAELAKHKDEAK